MTNRPTLVVPRAVARWRRNAILAAGRYGVAALLALWVTRYALERLGPKQFGVWALASALVPLLRLLDLGVSRALTRAVAVADGEGDVRAALPALAAGKVMLVLLGLTVLAGMWLLRGLFVQLLAVPPELVEVTAYVLVGTAALVLVENIFGSNLAALEGLGRMDLTSGVDTVQRLASALGVVVVLALGWGLPGLVWKNLLTALLAGIAYRRLLAREAPVLSRASWRLDPAAARAVLAFGRHVQTVNLASLLVEPVAKTLLSRSWGLDAVTLLDLALRVTSQLGGAFLAFCAALFPAAVATRARAGHADDRAMVSLYRTAARLVGLLALPAFGLLAVLAGPFVAAWLGMGYATVAELLSVLALGWLLACLGLPAFLVAQGGGQARLATAAGLVTGGVSLASMLILVRPFGPLGAACAMAMGLAAGGLAARFLVARHYALPTRGPRSLPLRAWMALLAALIVAAGLAQWLPVSLLAVIGSGLAGLGVYAALLAASGVVTAAERAALRARLLRDAAPRAGA